MTRPTETAGGSEQLPSVVPDWGPIDDGGWIDRPLPEDDAIRAAHPMSTGRHDLYGEAMRLVGAKHSKAALVELVNWLLAERAALVTKYDHYERWLATERRKEEPR